jgi:hypothetical protein
MRAGYVSVLPLQRKSYFSIKRIDVVKGRGGIPRALGADGGKRHLGLRAPDGPGRGGRGACEADFLGSASTSVPPKGSHTRRPSVDQGHVGQPCLPNHRVRHQSPAWGCFPGSLPPPRTTPRVSQFCAQSLDLSFQLDAQRLGDVPINLQLCQGLLCQRVAMLAWPAACVTGWIQAARQLQLIAKRGNHGLQGVNRPGHSHFQNHACF